MFRNSSIGNRLTPRRKKKKQRQADLINVVEEGEGRQEGKESRESSKDQNAPVSM